MTCVKVVDLSHLLFVLINSIYEYNKITRQQQTVIIVVQQTLLTISVTEIEVKNPFEFCSHCKINKGL